MKTKYFLLPLLSALVLSSCGSTKITGNYLYVQGRQLRLRDAASASMLYAGTKDLAGINRFQSRMPINVSPDLKADVITSLEFSSIRGSKGSLKFKDIPGFDQPGVEWTTGKEISSSFVVFGSRNEQQVIDELNAPQNNRVRDYLQSQAPNCRVITAVATTLNYNDKRTIKLDSGLTVDMKALQVGVGSIVLAAGTTRETRVGFSDKTVFAYTMSTPAWTKDANGKIILGDLVEDRRSILGRVPQPDRGCYFNPAEIP